MFSYLAVSVAVVVVCGIVGSGFYVGVRHVQTLSGIERNRERPAWAQQPVDAFNHVIGRPTSPGFAEGTLQDDEDDQTAADKDDPTAEKDEQADEQDTESAS